MMRPAVRTLVAAASFLLCFSAGAQKPVDLKGNPPAAQQSSAAANQEPAQDDVLSIRSFSRMVLVDVVARDSQGKPIPGLTANDFEVLEDGQPQKIVSFLHETAGLTPTAAQMTRTANPQVSPELVTNQKDDIAPPSMIVLDLLNTPSADRQMAQRALVAFLKERMRQGETVAIFVLGNRLELLQDFSKDPKHITAAAGNAQRAVVDPNPKSDAADAAFFAHEFDGLSGLPSTTAITEAIYRNEKEIEAQRTILRVNRTLEAMRSLARFSARHQGRKSLVWLSAGFPFFLLTDMGMTGFETEMRQTSNLLASAQVAVYPVDVRGLVNIEAQPLEDRQRRAQVFNPTENVYHLRTESIKRDGEDRDLATPQSYMENKFNFSQSQDTMKEIADLTGGTAYLNRNDLDVAIASALDENRDIYTLGYYPAKKDFNNRFRKIKVRLKGKESAVLRYRRGYYATGFSVETRANSDLIAALENDPAISPQIPLISRVDPNAPAANQPFKVQLFVQGGSIHYSDSATRAAAFLDFAVVALAPDGTPITRTFRRGELKFSKAGLEKAEKAGFIYTLPVNLPAGEYKLRAGVRDSFTGRIGTVEIPVVVK